MIVTNSKNDVADNDNDGPNDIIFSITNMIYVPLQSLYWQKRIKSNFINKDQKDQFTWNNYKTKSENKNKIDILLS